MKKISTVYQVVYVMDDGQELPWKIFMSLGDLMTFSEGISLQAKRALGIRSISYRVRHIE